MQIEEEILLDNCRRLSYPILINSKFKKLVLIQKDQNFEQPEQVIGYLCLQPISAKTYHVADFYIKKEWRKMGAGTKLFTAGMDFLKQNEIAEVSLYLDDANQGAGNFYRKFGFKPVQKSKFDWLDKNDKIVATNSEHLLKLEI